MIPPRLPKTRRKKKVPSEVTEMSYTQLRTAKEYFYKSDILHYVEHFLETINGTPPLTAVEQEAMDIIVEAYNTRYKSPLAKAMSELVAPQASKLKDGNK